MKLQYRGNSYEHNLQSIETVDSEITAKFRGATYKIKQQDYRSSITLGRGK